MATLRLSLPARALATVCGIGFAPKAAGTAASLAALPFAWALLQWPEPFGRIALGGAALAVFLLGVWASARYAEAAGRHDPGEVVIDEVAGQWLALLLAAPTSWWHFALAFALFRLFDIAKPWPVNVAQDALPGGWGIMADDIVAAGYALALFWATLRLVEMDFVQRLF